MWRPLPPSSDLHRHMHRTHHPPDNSPLKKKNVRLLKEEMGTEKQLLRIAVIYSAIISEPFSYSKALSNQYSN